MIESDVEKLLLDCSWRFAKTMPENPHDYTRKKEWDDPDAFECVVAYIQEHGFPERFYKSVFHYLYLDDYKYWTMGNPINETILINRASVAIGKNAT